ncbi:hypothetical protein L917_18893, partial [Phytophthora nicotianae]
HRYYKYSCRRHGLQEGLVDTLSIEQVDLPARQTWEAFLGECFSRLNKTT